MPRPALIRILGVHYVWEKGGHSMNQKAFLLTAGAFFALFALVHLLRILFGVAVVVHDMPVPLWASGIAVVIAGYLGYQGIRLARKAT
jgi:hypothetical protein